MNTKYRIHIAALIQKYNEPLFSEVRRAYARQHSAPVSQYMAKQLKFWDEGIWNGGNVEIQPSSLERFEKFEFPAISEPQKKWLISLLYDECLKKYQDTYDFHFRIDDNIDEEIGRLRESVATFNSEEYVPPLTPGFFPGIVWICQGEEDEARDLLWPFRHNTGIENYMCVCDLTEGFIRSLKRGELPIPFKQRFEFPNGYIAVDYNYTLGARVCTVITDAVDSVKQSIFGLFGGTTKQPPPPATSPSDHLKFKCPKCLKVMILTKEEYFRDTYACPYCDAHGVRARL